MHPTQYLYQMFRFPTQRCPKTLQTGIATATHSSHVLKWHFIIDGRLNCVLSSYRIKSYRCSLVESVLKYYSILATKKNADACFDIGPYLIIVPKKQRKTLQSNPLHASSAVNTNDLAVYPVAILGGKEADHAGNVYWLANTVVRGPSASELVDLVVAELVTSWDVLAADGVVHVGLDATGCDTVDSNLLLASICVMLVCCLLKIDSSGRTDSHAPGEGLNSTL